MRERDFSEKANKLLRTYNTKMKISRQELLMKYLNLYLVDMANTQVKSFQTRLEEVGADEIARQAAILGMTIPVSQSAVRSIVGQSLYGAVWSTRIWGDMVGLRSELDHIINSAVIRGVNPNKFVPDIKERFSVNTYEAKRLLQTESARVQVSSQKLSYEEVTNNDPEAKYQFIAKIDDRTTKICRGLDGKEFYVKDMQVGVNASPMHPFCRSSSVLLTPDDWREKFFSDRKNKYSI